MTRIASEGGRWFAWFPVQTYLGGWVWLASVHRERIVSEVYTGPWRYFTV